MIQLILGTVYGYSIFWEPLTAEVFPPVVTKQQKAALEQEGKLAENAIVVEDEAAAKKQRAIHQGYLKYAFSICILAFAVTMVFAGRVQDLKGPRFPAIVGAALLGGGFLAAGLMKSAIVFHLAHAAFVGAIALLLLLLLHALTRDLDPESYPVARYAPLGVLAAVIVAGAAIGSEYVGRQGPWDKLLLLWGTVGLLAGAGIGFAYVCPIAALVKWFPEHKGLVSGLAVAGFGFGAYLFSKEYGALGYIRAHGIVPFFTVHGLVCLVVIIVGALLLRNPPEAAPATAAKAVQSGESTWQETLRKPAFYLLWLMFFSGAMAGLMVIGILKVFAGEQLVSAALQGGGALSDAARQELMLKGAAAVGWLAIFNAVGRVVWGFVSDRIGRTSAFIAMFLFQAVTMFTLGAMKSELTIAVAASVVGFNFGGNFALFPSATADLFGAKNLGANYGWVFTSYGIAGVVGIAAGNAAKVATGSYVAAFALSGVLCVLSAGMALILHRMRAPQSAAA